MNKICICFAGGTYGNYLTWLLYVLTNPGELKSPFLADGSSHNLKNALLPAHKQLINDTFTLKNVFSSNADRFPQIARIHPKEKNTDSVEKTISTVISKLGKTILLYPTKNSYLLSINNYFYKIWKDPWHGPLKYINPDDLYNNFDVDRSITMDKIPKSIMREFLSYNLFPSWEDQLEWNFVEHYHNDQCLVILVDDLLYNLKNTLERICIFYQINPVRDFDELIPYQEENISLQKYLTQDQLAKDIVDAVINSTELHWRQNDITLPTEAWIQRELRLNGYELRCFGLDIFPTNSSELTQLVYKP